MIGAPEHGGTTADEQASDWWSRMRGPDAERSRAEFEAWLEVPEHKAAYASRERAWSASEGLGATEMGRNRSLGRHRSPFASLTLPRVAIAAAVAAAAVALVVFVPMGGQQYQQAAATELATGIGEIRTETLPDGSQVTLDTDSQIRVRYASDVRQVELVRGRARFDVRDDKSRAFVVLANGARVDAPQARFDAALAPEGLCLTAWIGAVEVRPDTARPRPDEPFLLQAGRSVVISPLAHAPLNAVAPDKGSEQWAAGMLVYQGKQLAEVLAETNRYSRQKIILGEPSLGALKVTGTFRPIPVEGLATSLSVAFDLRVGRDSSRNFILERH